MMNERVSVLKKLGKHTGSVLPLGDLDKLLDVADFFRLFGIVRCVGAGCGRSLSSPSCSLDRVNFVFVAGCARFGPRAGWLNLIITAVGIFREDLA